MSELLNNAFFDRGAYNAGFGLDYIGQPSLVVGADRFGTFIGGGASLFWSDMLGGQNLATALQVNGGVKDISALVGYTNLENRLNWGVVAQQIPYRSVQFGLLQDSTGLITEVERTFRQINRNLGGTIAYPFNRSQRLEFTGAYTNVTFDLEDKLRFFAPTGQFLGDEKVNVPLDFQGLTGLRAPSSASDTGSSSAERLARSTTGPPSWTTVSTSCPRGRSPWHSA